MHFSFSHPSSSEIRLSTLPKSTNLYTIATRCAYVCSGLTFNVEGDEFAELGLGADLALVHAPVLPPQLPEQHGDHVAAAGPSRL